MKKKQKSTQQTQSSIDGVSNLMDSYILALEGNSAEITDMLNELSSRGLKESDKKSLQRLTTELRKIDKRIDKIR